MDTRRYSLSLIAGSCLFCVTAASGTELKVVTRPDLMPMLSVLAPQIEEVTGAALLIDTSPSSSFDIALVDTPTIAWLVEQRRVAADAPRSFIGRIGTGGGTLLFAVVGSETAMSDGARRFLAFLGSLDVAKELHAAGIETAIAE